MDCINWNELEWDEVMAGMKRKVIHADGFTIVLVDLSPHLDLPVHSHLHEQAVMLLEGRLDFFLEDETRTIGPGDVIRIPPGAHHGAKVRKEPTRLIDLFMPQRDEFPASVKTKKDHLQKG